MTIKTQTKTIYVIAKVQLGFYSSYMEGKVGRRNKTGRTEREEARERKDGEEEVGKQESINNFA